MYALLFLLAVILGLVIDYIDKVQQSSLEPLKSDTYCVKNAVKDLIDICVEYGQDHVDDGARKKTAVMLSLCELQTSGIEYPFECNTEDIDTCARKLQQKEQLWTTYSGNYRYTFQVCYSEAMPFAKDHILSVFYNVTKAYNDMLRNLQKALEQAKAASDENRKENDQMRHHFSQWRQTEIALMESFSELYQKKLDLELQRSVEYVSRAGMDSANSLLSHISSAEDALVEFLDHVHASELEKLALFQSSVLENLGQVDEYTADLHESLQSGLVVSESNKAAADKIKRSLQEVDGQSENLIRIFEETALAASDNQQKLSQEFESCIFELSGTVSAAATGIAENIEIAFALLSSDIDEAKGKLEAATSQIDLFMNRLSVFSLSGLAAGIFMLVKACVVISGSLFALWVFFSRSFFLQFLLSISLGCISAFFVVSRLYS